MTKNEYKILSNKLSTVQKERDHFAKLLDTTQHHENDMFSRSSSSESISNDEFNDSLFENKDKSQDGDSISEKNLQFFNYIK